MTVYASRLSPTANVTGTSGANASYDTVRASTAATSTSGTAATAGQSLSGGNYTVGQYFLTFNTSTIPAATRYAILSLYLATSGSGDILEVREVSSAANMIAGASLGAAGPLLGSAALVGASAARTNIVLDLASMTRGATVILCVYSQEQRLDTDPTGVDSASITTITGTAANRPYLDITGPWEFVGISPAVETTGTTLTLTEPSGVVDGDLLVAMIASRTTATTAPTGTGWTAVGSQNNNNTLTTTSALASGIMLYRVRSGTPTLAFTLPAGNTVAMGRIAAYRGVTPSSPVDASTAVTTAINTTTVSVTGVTTTADDDLIVAMTAGGQEATWLGFNNLTSGLGASADTGTYPPVSAWTERADSITTTGADTSLGVFDAVKPTASATGNLSVTASLGAGHVVIAGAFKRNTTSVVVPVSMLQNGLTIRGAESGAPAYGSSTSTSLATRTDTILSPPGSAAFPFQIAIVMVGATGSPPTVTPPAGWTSLFTATEINDGSTNRKLYGWYRQWQEGDGAPVTFSHSSCSSIASIHAYSNVSGLTPVDVQSSNSGTGTLATGTSLTTTAHATERLLFIGQDWSTTTGTRTPPNIAVNFFAGVSWLAGADTSYSLTGGRARATLTANAGTNNPRITKTLTGLSIGQTYRVWGGKLWMGTSTPLYSRVATLIGVDSGSSVYSVGHTIDGQDIDFTFVATATTMYYGIVPVVTTIGQYGEIDDSLVCTLNAATAMTERFDAITYLADLATTAIGVTGDALMTVTSPWQAKMIALVPGGATVSLASGSGVSVTLTPMAALTITCGDETVVGKASTTISAVPGLTMTLGDESVTVTAVTSVIIAGVPQMTMTLGDETVGLGVSVDVTSPALLTISAGDVFVPVPTIVNVTGEQLTISVGDASVSGPMQVFATGNFMVISTATPSVRVDMFAAPSVTVPGMTITCGDESIITKVNVQPITGMQLAINVGDESVTAKANVTLTTLPALVATAGSVSSGTAMIVNVTGMELTVSTAAPGAITVNYGIRVIVTGMQLTCSIGSSVYVPQASGPVQREGFMKTMANMMGN